MTTSRLVSIRCPICKEKFNTVFISSCGYASKRTDFRPNYWGMNPVEYFYHLCPNCGFCGSSDVFDTKISNDLVKDKILKLGKLSDITLTKKLERRIKCYEILHKFHIVTLEERTLMEYWLEVYWWAEKEDDIKMYGKLVCKYLENLLKEESEFKELICFKYLLGEINRRMGYYNKANSIFKEVISSTNNDKEYCFLNTLATQQLNDPQENIQPNL